MVMLDDMVPYLGGTVPQIRHHAGKAKVREKAKARAGKYITCA